MATGYKNESRYQQLLDAVTNPKKFTYDPEKDPAYAALRKMYLREGQRATADTLAQASAATGGRPSSYAVTAAQQAGDNYAAKLSDTIPTLEQNAYQRYLNDLELKRNALNVLSSDRADYLENADSWADGSWTSQAVGSASDAVAALDKFAANTHQTVQGEKRQQELTLNEVQKYVAAGWLTPEQAQTWWNQYYVGAGDSVQSPSVQAPESNNSATAPNNYSDYARATINYLKNAYPNYVITNVNDWQQAAEILGGHDKLQQLGYFYAVGDDRGGGGGLRAQQMMKKYQLN